MRRRSSKPMLKRGHKALWKFCMSVERLSIHSDIGFHIWNSMVMDYWSKYEQKPKRT
jgi:hypothetical protein